MAHPHHPAAVVEPDTTERGTRPMQRLSEALEEARQQGELPADAAIPAPARAVGRALRRAELTRRTVAYFAALADGKEPASDQSAPGDLDQPLDGRPACPTCRGLRKVRYAVEVGHSQFGQVRDCPACLARPDVAPLMIADRALNAGLSRDQLERTFETFRPTSLSRAAYDAAREWARRVNDWLVIHGEPGSGKTHLAVAVVNELAAAGRRVRYWYAPDLARAAKRQISQGGNAEDDFVRQVKELPILVLDDLGAAQLTDYVLRIFEEILDHRYRHRLATLFTLISSPAEARAGEFPLSESICRRMEDRRVCQVIHNQAAQWGGE